jgi:uncharacterized membrane protein (DUF485 family)
MAAGMTFALDVVILAIPLAILLLAAGFVITVMHWHVAGRRYQQRELSQCTQELPTGSWCPQSMA